MNSEHLEEQYLLVECLRWYARGEAVPGLVRRPPHWEILDWVWLFKLAARHRVTPFLFHFLGETQWVSNLEPSLRAILKVQAENCKKQFQLQTSDYHRLMVDLAHSGFEVLPLKGMALAMRIYRDFPYRLMRDLDLLVHAEDLPRLCAWLGSQGFAYGAESHRSRELRKQEYFLESQLSLDPHHPLNPFGRANTKGREGLTNGQISVDLHWELNYRSREHRIRLDPQEFWSAANPASQTESGLVEASTECLFFHTFVHLGNLFSPKLVQIIDCLILLRHLRTSDKFSEIEKRAMALSPFSPKVFRCLKDLTSPTLDNQDILTGLTQVFGKKIFVPSFERSINGWTDSMVWRNWQILGKSLLGDTRGLDASLPYWERIVQFKNASIKVVANRISRPTES